MKLEKLEEAIGHTFRNKELLKIAMTHASYANEYNCESNEKLEFLGDSILEYVSSDYIYQKYPKLKEVEMTKVRATVVCENCLHKIARRLNFSDFLQVGKSERLNHGNTRPAVMADSVEAVIAAIYFDGGLEKAREFIISILKDEIEVATHEVGMKDYKTVLQEMLQAHGDVKIEYVLKKTEGPDHNKTFYTEMRCNGETLADGVGKSKKTAEMVAAQKAIEMIKAKRKGKKG